MSAGSPQSVEGQSASGNNRTSWPKPGFKLEDLLPGSVYLWACNERGEDDGCGGEGRDHDGTPVSDPKLPEAVAAWIILITQGICYAGLWHVSGNQPYIEDYSWMQMCSECVSENQTSFEGQTSSGSGDSAQGEISSGSDPDYSILAIAGAMYLLLTIAAADVWGGLALCLEGRGSADFKFFTGRRAFGAALLGTFVALIGASIRVLFYSSFENVDLVIGAATVLFIADVDEKAMQVLKNVSAKWRLFWVLEVIGLSFLLAVLAVKVTGNGGWVAQEDADQRFCLLDGCLFYTWHLIIFMHPLGVTVSAWLLSSAVSAPKSSLAGMFFLPTSIAESVFTLCMCCCVVVQFFALSGSSRIQEELGLNSDAVENMTDAVGLGCAVGWLLFLIFLCGKYACGRRFPPAAKACAKACFRVLTSWTRINLLLGGMIVTVYSFYVEYVIGHLVDDFETYAKYYALHDFLMGVHHLALDLWLISALNSAGTPVHGVIDQPNQFCGDMKWMFLGWAVNQSSFGLGVIYRWLLSFLSTGDFSPETLAATLFIDFYVPDFGILVWKLVVGTWLRTQTEKDGQGGRDWKHRIAFWAVAGLIGNTLLACTQVWARAWLDGILK